MGDVEPLLELVFDHPAPEPDWGFGHDQDFLLLHDVHVVLHLRRECMGTDAQTALEREGVEGDPDLGVQPTAVYDCRQLAVHLGDQDVFVLDPMPVKTQQLGIDPDRHDIVIVALDMDEGLDVGKDGRDFLPADLAYDHLFAVRKGVELGGIRGSRIVHGAEQFFKVDRHSLPPVGCAAHDGKKPCSARGRRGFWTWGEGSFKGGQRGRPSISRCPRNRLPWPRRRLRPSRGPSGNRRNRAGGLPCCALRRISALYCPHGGPSCPC